MNLEKFGNTAYSPTFENPNFLSLSWIGKNWKVQLRATFKYLNFQYLCKLGKNVSTTSNKSSKNLIFESMDELGKNGRMYLNTVGHVLN